MASILVMEDEKPQAELLADALSYMGHTVNVASNCNAAMEVLESRKIDLILTDLIVPKRDGEAPQGGILLVSRVRTSNNKNIRKLPIIAMSGAIFHSREMLGEMLRDMGVEVFLEKPINLDSLGSQVDTLITAAAS